MSRRGAAEPGIPPARSGLAGVPVRLPHRGDEVGQFADGGVDIVALATQERDARGAFPDRDVALGLATVAQIVEIDDSMNSKHVRTLRAIFKDPVSGTIERAAVEGLLIAAGCSAVEGSGPRIRFVKDGMIEAFHRPHPAKEAKRYQVRAARAYLTRSGVTA